jgi:hypothetical protein
MSVKNTFCPDAQDRILPMLYFKRAEEDAELLKKLFFGARRLSSTAGESLDWAKENGVTFFVDHVCEMGGYYLTGTGIIAISKKSFNKDKISTVIGTLTHEIRHAWQDRHGVLGNANPNLLDDLRAIALFEADASAFDKRAEAEAEISLAIEDRAERKLLPTAFNIITSYAAQKTDLYKNFIDWFQYGPREKYCARKTDLYAEKWLGKKAPVLDFELQCQALQKNWKVFDSRNPNDLLQLTRHFNGRSYMPQDNAVQELLDLTDPAKACRFFADGPVSPLLDAVLQKEIEAEIKNNPPPRFLQLMQPQKA